MDLVFTRIGGGVQRRTRIGKGGERTIVDRRYSFRRDLSRSDRRSES